ncbi:MAG: N-acetylmuramoyl-L-alanine amidase [bacterium]|nr:N-acetylmuramoyl-L-alanine amidase [bacterium]
MLRTMIAILTILLACSVSAMAQDIPKIEVIYPTPNQRITAVDSTFIFGNVTPGSELTINKTPVTVHPNGAFLAFLPIKSGKFAFALEAKLRNQKTLKEIPLEVPEPYIVPESLAIVKGYMSPSSDVTLMEGDLWSTGFRGTPGLHGYFLVSTKKTLVPMTESPPVPQSYWAQAVFGEGDFPDSLLVKGSYNGNLQLDNTHIGDTAEITYYLCRKPLRLWDSRDRQFPRQLDSCKCTVRRNDARVTVWPKSKVVVGELTDSTQTLRVGPRKGYFSVFQPRGLRVRVTGFANNHYRARLVENQDVWVSDSSIRLLPEGSRIPSGEFALIRTRRVDDGVTITFTPGAQLPFDVDYDPLRHQLVLDVFNCTSSIDWIRYDATDSMIAAIDFEQLQVGVVRLKIDLNETLWGYNCSYDGNQFILKLNRRPQLSNTLRGIKIVVDPGHSPDPGASGPTGYKEKDANLAIALQLKELLEKEEATVFMTRSGDTPLPLYERPVLAQGFDADIFISIHNNAVPDGVNPLANNGTSTFYYHPQSQELATLVHRRMVPATELNDYGLYHGNFAVIRPTEYLSILVECAFMMIPEQEMALQTEEFRGKIARAICDGVLDFVEKESERSRENR